MAATTTAGSAAAVDVSANELHVRLRSTSDARLAAIGASRPKKAARKYAPGSTLQAWIVDTLPGCKKTNPLLYKTETDFGDLQIIVLSHIFVQIIVLSLVFPDYRISTREI